MELQKEDKELLAQLIIRNIEANFAVKHISKNLIKTIKVEFKDNGDFFIDIPAQIYDLKLWNEKKAIVYSGKGSYANLVNKTGGFSKTHKNYVEIAIDNAIVQWLPMIKEKYGDNNTNWKVKKS